LSGGITKVSNAFYLGLPRVYVDSAPHFVANAGLTASGWHKWSGSFRMRAINHYRLDGEDPSIAAAGHTVFDLWISRNVSRQVDVNVGVDNLLNRAYYETQNYFESRLKGADPAFRIHATPGYSRSIFAGITIRLMSK